MASLVNEDAQPPSCHVYEMYSPVLNASKPTTTDNDVESPTFHLFPHLPAELRVRIWIAALRNETTFYETRDLNNEYWERYSDIDIHMECDDILVMTRRSYPTLFFVNRESRAEAARLDGGKWYPLGIKNTNVYANVEKDVLWVHDCCADFLDYEAVSGLAQFELDTGELYIGLECTDEV